MERYTKEQRVIIVKKNIYIYYKIYYKIKSCAVIGTPHISQNVRPETYRM